jgi:hypothetical protein
VSVRDLPFIVARAEDGATTVASTSRIAAMAGIHVFATGRHRRRPSRGGADLRDFRRHDGIRRERRGRAMVAKAILDLALTLETLETLGVPVIGLGTDEFPAFDSRQSGHKVPMRCDTPAEVAGVMHMQNGRGLESKGGVVVVANPNPPGGQAAYSGQRDRTRDRGGGEEGQRHRGTAMGKETTPSRSPRSPVSPKAAALPPTSRSSNTMPASCCEDRRRLRGRLLMNVQRRGRRADAAHTPSSTWPWAAALEHTLEPLRILSDDQIEAIDRQSLKVLEVIGMARRCPRHATSCNVQGMLTASASGSGATSSSRR